MGHVIRSVEIAAPVDVVVAFHCDTTNLPRISPRGARMTIHSVLVPDGGGEVGKRVRLRVGPFRFLRLDIEVEFHAREPPHLLTDRQIRRPFRMWEQTRVFSAGDNGTLLTDRVAYELPFGPLGRLAGRLLFSRSTGVNGEVES